MQPFEFEPGQIFVVVSPSSAAGEAELFCKRTSFFKRGFSAPSSTGMFVKRPIFGRFSTENRSFGAGRLIRAVEIIEVRSS
jgi:hypothetical protein